METEQRLREQAEQEAIRVFGRNLHDLLLAAPAGQRVTMGLDPGIRTGVKVAVVDGTGKVLETATVYPHEPRKDWDRCAAPRWDGWPRRTACSSSPSATAPRRARPTRWPPIS